MKLFNTAALILLLSDVAQGASTVPPSDGKFFYADFKRFGEWGHSKMQIWHGNKRRHLDVWLTSQEIESGLVSHECSYDVCHAPQDFNSKESDTAVALDGEAIH